MKQYLVLIFALTTTELSLAASVQQYLDSVDKIRTTYAEEIRYFLRQLDPQLTAFSPEQQARYCQIHEHYISQMSDAIEHNRASLPAQYATVSKQDLIRQVIQSKEMQMLAKYNVRCDFK